MSKEKQSEDVLDTNVAKWVSVDERLPEKPEAQKTVDELKNQIEIAKEKYKAKRKEFYANRKQDHPTEKGGE